MNEFRERLSGGTRTSVGDADEVIQQLLTDTTGLSSIYELFLDEDSVVAMRSSYVAMRVAEQQPSTVEPFAEYLFSNFGNFTQQEVRWHVPQLIGHLALSDSQKLTAYQALMSWAETDKSKIVGYYSLQTAADIAQTNKEILNDFTPRLKAAYQKGSKSIQNRCKKISKQLGIEI